MRRTRAGGPARGSEIPRAAPWVLASPLTGEVAAQQPEGVHGEGQSPSPAARSRLTATYFSLVRKVGKSQRLRLWGRTLQKPFLLTAPKETVFEIQRKALTGPSVHPPIDRRAKSGHSLLLFPLLLHCTRLRCERSIGRAPSSGACWEQAMSRGPGSFLQLPMERRAETGSREYRLTSTPEREPCITLSCSPVKTGVRGCRRFERKRALGA